MPRFRDSHEFKRYRILKTPDGRYVPQRWSGFFGWRRLAMFRDTTSEAFALQAIRRDLEERRRKRQVDTVREVCVYPNGEMFWRDNGRFITEGEMTSERSPPSSYAQK